MKTFEELFGDVTNSRPLYHFYNISQIPRPAHHEEAISAYMQKFGEGLGLKSYVDEVGNVTIIKPASPGYENHPAVALQAHLDIVAEKRPGVVHDFLKDPIKLVRTGDKVMADGTTLGADDGYGMATIMAILEDKTLRHPKLEAFFTVHEETDMLGASHYDINALDSKKLINLDGTAIQVAGSGEKEIIIKVPLATEPVAAGAAGYKLTVGGLMGGHSGSDAMAERSNAIVLLNRTLCAFVRAGIAYGVCGVKGGAELSSSIPRDATALLALSPADAAAAAEIVIAKEKEFKTENHDRDPDFSMAFEPADLPATALTAACAKDLRSLLTLLPDGVYTRDHNWPGAMECCCNVGVLYIEGDYIVVKVLIRSAHLARKAYMVEKILTAAAVLGMEHEFGRDLPHWEYNLSEEFLSTVKRFFDDTVRVGSGTVEMGFFAEKRPELEQISLSGPRYFAHSPEEYFMIPDMLTYYDKLVALLENL